MIMLKQLFVLAITAILFFIKPSFASTEVSSEYAKPDSSSDITSKPTNGVNYSGEKCNKPHQKCGANETFVQCPDTVCVPKTCEEVGYPVPCIDLSPDGKCPSEPACICIEGYVKNSRGICIPMKKCPSCGGDTKAESGCGVNCRKHCSDYFAQPRPCPKICNVNACDCKQDYFYDDNVKKCVSPNKCTKVCRDNEVFSECVNGGCDKRNCSQLDQPKVCVDPIACKKGCVCREAYLRHPNGTCVPLQKCPSVCGANEVYNACLENVCKATDCRQLGYPFACAAVVPTTCTEGCLCKDGYLRDHNKNCVPAKSCPSCGGDTNAEAGCGIYCNRRCSDIGSKPKICNDICNTNTCDCKKGLYLDDNTGKCVPPQNCTLTCKKDEVYNDCIQGQCGPKNCSELGQSLPCPRIDPRYCNEGCLCKEDYLRADDGSCISEHQCQSTATTTTTPASPVDTDIGLVNLRKGNIALTWEFVYLLNKMHPGDSLVLSAISVLIAYAQLTLYAFGLVLEQLLRATNLNSKDEIRKVFAVLIKSYEAPTTAVFQLAIKCYGNINYPFTETFRRQAIDIFNSEAENLDFSENDKAADTINSWVTNKTHGLIDNLVDRSMFSGDTRLVLVNAIYFWDNWKHQFNPNDTENRDFYLKPNQTKSIPTMYQQGSFNYYESEELDAQILEMPYKADNFSFVLWLPKTKDGLSIMVDKLRNPETVIKSISSFTSKRVKIYLPVMKIKSKLNIKDLSIKANITEMFNSHSDGFKGILKTDTPVYVSNVEQQAEIIVTETGTEAAAATAVTVTTLSAVYPPPEIIIVDANRHLHTL